MSVTFIPNEKTRDLLRLKQEAPFRKAKQNIYKRFHDMGREHFLEFENMLFCGEFPATIAEYIQETWGQFKDVKRITLTDLVKKYRAEMIMPRMTRKGRAMTKTEEAAVSTLNRQVDTAKLMDDIILMQKARIDKIYLKEQKMPLLFNFLGGELRIMGDLIGKRQMLDVQSGMQQRLKKGGPLMEFNVTNTSTQNYFATRMQTADDVARATMKLLQELDGNVIEAEVIEEDAA